MTTLFQQEWGLTGLRIFTKASPEPLGKIPAGLGGRFGSYLMETINDPAVDFIFIKREGALDGILCAELDRCGAHPPLWTVRLVCTNYLDEGCKGVAAVLMACYCRHIKRLNQPYGLLELAGGFANIRAYCLYTKFGFRPAADFTCRSMTNVVMVANMAEYTDGQLAAASEDPVCRPGVEQNMLIAQKNADYIDARIHFLTGHTSNIIS